MRAFTSPAFGQSVIYTVIFTVVSAIIGQNVLGHAARAADALGHEGGAGGGQRHRDRRLGAARGGGRLPVGGVPRAGRLAQRLAHRARAAHPELAVHHADPGRVAGQHLARDGVLDAGLLRGAVGGAQGDRGGRRRRRRRPVAQAGVGDAADAAPHHRHQPDADHPADAVGVRPDLDHDQGRAQRPQHDPAAVRLPAGLPVLRARLRHRAGAGAAAHRRRLLA